MNRPLIQSPASRIALLLAATFPTALCAADAPSGSPGLTSALQTFAALAVILVLFIGAAWLLRRINGGKGVGNSGPLRTIGGITLGARERIILVEVEDTWLVVGLAPGQMRTLHVMPRGELPPQEGGGKQFAEWLRQLRETPKNVGN